MPGDGNSIALDLTCAVDLVDVGHLGYLTLWLLSFLLVVIRLRDFYEMKPEGDLFIKKNS